MVREQKDQLAQSMNALLNYFNLKKNSNLKYKRNSSVTCHTVTTCQKGEKHSLGKMSSNKFLEVDITKLFEAHTIKEIEQIQKQIQQESERKKIELRTLVG